MKTRQKIDKSMLIGELLEKYPNLAEVLVDDYGFHCVGCMAAGEETLEQGAQVHGYSAKKIGKMVEALNAAVEEKAGK